MKAPSKTYNFLFSTKIIVQNTITMKPVRNEQASLLIFALVFMGLRIIKMVL